MFYFETESQIALMIPCSAEIVLKYLMFKDHMSYFIRQLIK